MDTNRDNLGTEMSAHWFWSSTDATQVVNVTKTVAKSIAETPAKRYIHQTNTEQTLLHAVN